MESCTCCRCRGGPRGVSLDGVVSPGGGSGITLSRDSDHVMDGRCSAFTLTKRACSVGVDGTLSESE